MLSIAILDCVSKGISSSFIASPHDGCDWILPEIVACDTAERSDLTDAHCGRFLVAEATIRTTSALAFALSIRRWRRLCMRALHYRL